MLWWVYVASRGGVVPLLNELPRAQTAQSVVGMHVRRDGQVGRKLFGSKTRVTAEIAVICVVCSRAVILTARKISTRNKRRLSINIQLFEDR